MALKSMVAASGALLDSRTAAMPGYPDARVANSMQAHGRHFSVGDIVLLGSRAGVVLACVQEGDAFFVIVEELTLIEQITPQSATWRIEESVAYSLTLRGSANALQHCQPAPL